MIDRGSSFTLQSAKDWRHAPLGPAASAAAQKSLRARPAKLMSATAATACQASPKFSLHAPKKKLALSKMESLFAATGSSRSGKSALKTAVVAKASSLPTASHPRPSPTAKRTKRVSRARARPTAPATKSKSSSTATTASRIPGVGVWAIERSKRRTSKPTA